MTPVLVASRSGSGKRPPLDRGPARCSDAGGPYAGTPATGSAPAGTYLRATRDFREREATLAQDRYDVIVVGARCAGSPTAMLLARKGYSPGLAYAVVKAELALED